MSFLFPAIYSVLIIAIIIAAIRTSKKEKHKKELRNEMLNSICPSVIVKTDSGIVGKVIQVDEGGLIVIETGSENEKSYLRVEKNTVVEVLSSNDVDSELSPLTKHQSEENSQPKAKKTSQKNSVRFSFGKATFVIGIILAILAIAGFIFIPLGIMLFNSMIAYLAGLLTFMIAGFISHCLFNAMDDKSVATTIFFWLTIFPYWIVIVFISIMLYVITFIIRLFKDDFGGFSLGSKSEKVWEIRDERGSTRMLRKVGSKYIGGKEYKRYRDDLGYFWLSDDEEYFMRDK